ncbi:hypothetical protein ACHAWF_007282, partial [Thalassiosira exigua]
MGRRATPLWLAASTLVLGGGGGGDGGEGGKEVLGLPSAPSYRTQGHVFQAVKHDTLSKGECVDPAYVPAPSSSTAHEEEEAAGEPLPDEPEWDVAYDKLYSSAVELTRDEPGDGAEVAPSTSGGRIGCGWTSPPKRRARRRRRETRPK